jgi:hypothetical protein
VVTPVVRQSCVASQVYSAEVVAVEAPVEGLRSVVVASFEPVEQIDEHIADRKAVECQQLSPNDGESI